MNTKQFSLGVTFFKNMTNTWFLFIGAIVSIQLILGHTVAEINKTVWVILFVISIFITIFRHIKHSD